jgi:molybdate transport system permease protein
MLSPPVATLWSLTPEDWHAVRLSLGVSVCAVLLILPVGVALGWLLARFEFPAKTLVETAVNLPLVLPPVVTGYLLLVLFGRRGWIGEFLDRYLGIQIAFTWLAAVIVGAIVGFPLLVRSARIAFRGLDPRLYQAARSLGARPLDAFFSVVLPLARSGIVAGALLAFARSLGEFGATLLFAGSSPDRRTLTVQIYRLHEEVGPVAEARKWDLVLAAVLLSCAAVAVSEFLERRGRRRESA